ncbi:MULTISPECIES: hypothetical protein [unclassified Microcella]|uniref:hypothetical protein n=1 Tax=unclassified Microcella TaxID=2630066 RepID=UPI0006FF7FC3|nr:MULTISPECIES: hypothetical protein [unclassified Microcella]KQV26633.1 hypothetical protein ASC54_07215 [Yonghaparkia sp. Root332]KRF32588.1 hypothetical protein ASG83_00515 [Yonghaparkia sp. Soil809]
MWSLLARGGAAATALTSAALRTPAVASESFHRTIGLALVGLVLTSGAAIGTLALTADAQGAERGVSERGEVKTIRDLQLPTL